MEQKDSQWIFMKILSSDIFLYDVTDKRTNSYIKSPSISKSIVNVHHIILAYFYYNIEKINKTRPITYDKYINFENQTAKLPNKKFQRYQISF